MGAKRQKGKFPIFLFWRSWELGVEPLTQRPFLSETKKWVSAPFGEKISLHTRYILAHKRICGIQV